MLQTIGRKMNIMKLYEKIVKLLLFHFNSYMYKPFKQGESIADSVKSVVEQHLENQNSSLDESYYMQKIDDNNDYLYDTVSFSFDFLRPTINLIPFNIIRN